MSIFHEKVQIPGPLSGGVYQTSQGQIPVLVQHRANARDVLAQCAASSPYKLAGTTMTSQVLIMSIIVLSV